MKICIMGTRGIPNHYGGFEQFADILSQGLASDGNDVTVYCCHQHPEKETYKDTLYNGVKLIYKYDPEHKIGTAGQFAYDLLCMLDARNRHFDIIYLLGYTSSSIWQRIFYKHQAIIITNMDGLEWKRSKYSPMVQTFLEYAEKLAVSFSDYLVADSIGIQSYLKRKYNVKSNYLAYGSFVFKAPDVLALKDFDVTAYQYDMLVARFEPENNIEMILKAFSSSDVKRQLLLIGDYQHTDFGKSMFENYENDKRIRFLGPVYDQTSLDNLRYFSNLYFHGHSVGGTNPSLLEAMGSSALICYHDNEFNKAIVGDNGFAFSKQENLKEIINTCLKSNYGAFITENLRQIATIYSWGRIIKQYEKYFARIIQFNCKYYIDGICKATSQPTNCCPECKDCLYSASTSRAKNPEGGKRQNLPSRKEYPLSVVLD